VQPVSVRPSPEELERWRRCAARYPKLSFSAWARRAINEICAVEEANARNAARERQAGLEYHRLDPVEARRLDWGRTRPADEEGAK
jgi:hypothetical protein